MKFLKNKAKKALMAAVTMSLVMGAYGTASAANLYGAGGSGESISGVTPDKAATTFQEKATASGNEFTISAGTVSGDIYGGRTDNGYALNNQVSISGGNIGYDASGDPILGKGSIYGGYTENGLAQGNTVTISQAEGKTTQINGNVYGGYTEWFGTGDANNNIVNVSGGEMSFVGGGYTLNGSAVGNHVNVTGGKMLWVYGGFSGFSGLYGTATETLYASSNIVEISGAATEVANHVSGGSIRDGNAINNVAIVNGGTIGADVFGGEVINQGDATGNTVNISGGKIGRAVYGGYTEEGAATGNTVSISAGSIGGDVYGGKVGYYNKEHGEGDAVGNSVNITGSSITGDVYGGQTEKGAANGNKVGTSATNAATNFTAAGVCGGLGITGAASNEVWLGEGAEVAGSVYGGYTKDGTAGVTGTVEGNIVSIKGAGTSATERVQINGSVYGGYSENGAANGNKVGYMNGTTFGAATNFTVAGVYGGLGITGAASNEVWLGEGAEVTTGNVGGGVAYRGNAKSNSVNISGGTIGSSSKFVYGGYVHNEGNATGNTVTITGGTISSVVTGGRTDTGIAGGENATDGNKVTITGGTVNNAVYGGSSSNSSALNNSVEINGSAAKITGSVYGGSSLGSNGIAKGNKVDVKIGTLNKNVFGGFSGDSTAEENTVTISGGTVSHNVFGGYALAGGNAKSNSVNISGGTIGSSEEFVYGGYAVNGNATSNTVTIEGGTISSVVIGGHYDGVADSGKVTDGNKVTITGGTINNAVFGGTSNNHNVLNNSVEINGSAAKITGNVYGGSSWVYNGIAKGNKVDVKNGTLNKDVIGGFSGDSTAEENTVNVSGGTISGNVYGGDSNNGDVKSNTVTISGGEIGISAGYVYGAYTKEGKATNNTVEISDGTVNSVVIGGKNDSVAGIGKVTEDNKVIISGGTVNNAVYGGSSANNNALNNSVEIDGSTTKITGNVYGGFSGADNVEENTVTISGGTITGNVYGGKSADGTANDNVVNISGTADISTAEVYGGKGTFAGTGNTLNIDTWTGSKTMKSINDFQIINVIDTKEIEAGSADGLADGTVALDIQYANLATEVAALKATDKIVFINTNGSDDFFKKFSTAKLNGINKGEGIWSAKTTGFGVDASRAEFKIDTKKAFVGVTDVVLAGIFVDDKGNTTSQDLVLEARAKDYENIYGAYNAKNEAMAAIVNLNTAADLSKSTIYGNNVSAAGNTLNVKATGVKVKALKNFENMNFYIPADAKAGDTMVDVQEAVDLNKVNVAAGFHNDTTLTYGDKVKLINAPAVSGVNGVVETKVDDTDYTKYDVNIYQGDAGMNETASGATSLVAELVNSELTENAKSLVETMAAGTAILADSSDMLASAGFANAESALRADVEQGAPSGSMSIFGAVNGNKSRVKSGSYVDVKGWNFNMGAAKELVSKSGKLIFAPVVEYGRGSYDSYLNNGYHGEGKTEYVGGGLMAKKLNKGGSYVEGSVRAGKLSADYEATGGNYDSDSMYLAAHLGLGKVVKLSEKNSLDYYGKYFYSRQGSDDTTVNANGKNLDLHFDAVESHRTRLGGRFNHALGETNTVYAGLAWQHEFSSTARATLDGMGTPSPSMKGDTGILELGVKVSEADKYDLDFGVNGSIGKKKGAGLSLNFNWKF